jgi:uncharacterized coiled-coil DUF342 family protein
MKKKNEAEELWNKIRDKQHAFLAEYKKFGDKNLKLYKDLGDFISKLKGHVEAIKEISEIEGIGKASAELEWKRLEPMNSYMGGFMARQLDFHGSKEMIEYGETVNHGFARRMAETNKRIHDSQLSISHSVKLLLPFDKEIDEIKKQLMEYEKIIDETISEFKDIKRVAALEEN